MTPLLSDPLKKSYFATRELLLFYITCIRSILEYGSPVFHRTLPSYLSKDLERLQKHAMKIIYPKLSYAKALEYKAVSGSKFSSYLQTGTAKGQLSVFRTGTAYFRTGTVYWEQVRHIEDNHIAMRTSTVYRGQAQHIEEDWKPRTS